jgi:hypothetical protein
MDAAAASSSVVPTIDTSHHVYIKSKEHAWIPARVLELNEEGIAKVQIPEWNTDQDIGSNKKPKRFRTERVNTRDYPNQSLLLQNVNEHGTLQIVNDMVDLNFLHEVREEVSCTVRYTAARFFFNS